MVHGASGGIISQDLLYIIGEDKQQSWINQIVLSAKGQLISKANIKLFIYSKKPKKISKIFLYFCPKVVNSRKYKINI